MCLLAATPVDARGVSPYLPLNLDPELEREVERVLILGDRAVMTRPIPAAMVLEALPKACGIDPVLCHRVRRALKPYMQDSALEFASAELSAVNGESKMVIPNRYGQTEQSQWQIAGAGFIQPSDYLLFNLGGVAYDGRQKATGSFISLGWDVAQLDLGYRDHWWSPMTDSSMLISTESPSMPGVTISNWRPLTRFGWHYELFVERVSHTDNIMLAIPPGGVTAGYPKLAGAHLEIEPVNSGWSMAVNRIMMFGGGEAGGQSFGDLLKAFFDPLQAQSSLSSSGKPVLGKQEAAVTSRFLYPGHIPFSLYVEYAGNDTAGGNRLNFTKTDLSVGVQFPRLGPFDLTYEFSEWQPSWYVSAPSQFQYGYGDGVTNYLLSMGHWFGDQRVFRDAVGGQSNMLRLGYEPHFGGRLELTLRMLVNEPYDSATKYLHENTGSLTYSYPWKDYVVGSQVDYGRDVFGAHYTRFGVFLRYGDALFRGDEAADDSASAQQPAGMEFHIDAGAVASSVTADITSNTPRVTTGYTVGPHLTIGARRAASEHQDLGAAIDADDVHGLSLIGARFFDYRYRFASPIALNLFFGAARYAAPTPAYGLYFGAGLQWRNVLPHWDVGVDFRYASKVNRLRTLPTDPQGGYRHDAYYDISLGTLYVSRKF